MNHLGVSAHRLVALGFLARLVVAPLAATTAGCGDDTDDPAGSGGSVGTSAGTAGTTGSSGTTTTSQAATSGGGDGGSGGAGGSGATGGGGDGSGGEGAGGAAALPACGQRATAENPWIAAEFADAPVLTGDFTSRQFVELPHMVRDATGSTAKYAFDLREEEEPADPRAAFVNLTVTDLASPDGFGGAIQTASAPGARLFLSNVHVEPHWPAWQSYDTTNYDGLVLDGSEEIFAEDLTIASWNADSAADIKSERAQFVCLTTEGEGNRTLRFWAPGPHYLVKSSVNNPGGTLLWFRNCAGATVRIYDSTFDGEPALTMDRIECDEGSDPTIEVLTVDPRTTGEMHPMFSAE